MSRQQRVFFAILAVVALATSAWATISHTRASSRSDGEAGLEAPMPPPEAVFIRKRDNSDGLGNTLVLVQLSQQQVEAKQEDGTADFITLGNEKKTAILWDDGTGGDEQAGDGLYTAIAEADMEELQARAALDEEELANNPDELITLFEGRTATGVVRPAAFDFNGFEGGEAVTLNAKVSFPEMVSMGGPMPPPISSENPIVLGTTPFEELVVMINSTDVVTDPARTWNPCTGIGDSDGVWTFNHLMTGMANPVFTGFDPSVFVKKWLDKWMTSDVINDDPVPARNVMQHIIGQWPKLANGKLDLTKSPLRLLAIAPRIDLRGGNGGYSGGGFQDAGELRFVFGFVAKATPTFDPVPIFTGEASINSTSCYALPFTVIFEYRVPRDECEDIRDWAKKWKHLGTLIPGPSSAYNQKLEDLTEEVVVAGANQDEPNKSALGQLRTNEIALGAPWELREFRLTGSFGPFSYLEQTTVLDTIQDQWNNNPSGPLLSWIRDKVKPELLPNKFEAPIPLVTPEYLGFPFLAGASRVPAFEFHWTEPNLDVINDMPENWARHRVSRAGCNGCHSNETFTHFVHINSAETIPGSQAALPAELSDFLTGIKVGDRANALASSATLSLASTGFPKRNFDELARRAQDINNVAGMSCFKLIKLDHHEFKSERKQSRDDMLSIGVDDLKRNVVTEVH